VAPRPRAIADLRYALHGRVVTMDAARTVLDSGIVYVNGQSVEAVLPDGAPPPAGFAAVVARETQGTIYPGLIELHNHLSYNALPLWTVTQRYTNRDHWAGTVNYGRDISGPMSVLGRTDGYPEAIARYAECKCLLGGVTTSQGVALFSTPGITHYYAGAVRNVEQPNDPDLHAAATSIADIKSAKAAAFLKRLRKDSCLLLHLSEGTDAGAHTHFEALHLADGTWAIAPALAGIHCVALTAADFGTMQAHGASMIWSPLSNLILYGATADVRAAKAAGVRIGIGSDWSPSGSKNLLGELKAAQVVSAHLGGVFSDAEIVAMATCAAAAILRWDGTVGSIAAGKRADLLVIEGTGGDPYTALIGARETAIQMLIIDGVPRYGTPAMLDDFGLPTEMVRVGGMDRLLHLTDDDRAVGGLTLRTATDRLRDGLQRLPELALALEQPPTPHLDSPRRRSRQPRWFLALDQPGPEFSPGGERLGAGSIEDALAAALPLSARVRPVALDPLTVVDDPAYLTRLAETPNLPETIAQGIADLYA
jgi:5-methylthioadenosine/S-adenosylhomocysteine deaminase